MSNPKSLDPTDDDMEMLVTNIGGDDEQSDNVTDPDEGSDDDTDNQDDLPNEDEGSGTENEGSEETEQEGTTTAPTKTDQQSTRATGKAEQLSDRDAAIKYRQLQASTIPAFQRHVAALEAENKQLKQHTEVVQAFQTTLNQFGLNIEEARLGLQMASGFKTNPKKLIEGLLAHAKAQNIQIDGHTADAQSIAQIVQQQLAPLLAQVQPQQEQQQREQVINTAVDQLFMKHPDAGMQSDLIIEIVNKERVSLEEAYLRAKVLVAETGLDWNSDLRAQMTRQPQRRNSSRVPNVSTRQSGVHHANGAQLSDKQFPVNMSNRAATRQLLAELGLR